MFTGIVRTVGEVVERQDKTVRIASDISTLSQGDSISVMGVCLTAREVDGESFIADLSEETIARSTLGSLEVGSKVNLELPMAVDGRFDGHLVQGHTDAVAEVKAIEPKAGSTEVFFGLPTELMSYVVEKGSVTIDGVSLTTNEVTDDGFWVSLIPHTLEGTTLSELEVGRPVNVEVDLIARYLERLNQGGKT